MKITSSVILAVDSTFQGDTCHTQPITRMTQSKADTGLQIIIIPTLKAFSYHCTVPCCSILYSGHASYWRGVPSRLVPHFRAVRGSRPLLGPCRVRRPPLWLLSPWISCAPQCGASDANLIRPLYPHSHTLRVALCPPESSLHTEWVLYSTVPWSARTAKPCPSLGHMLSLLRHRAPARVSGISSGPLYTPSILVSTKPEFYIRFRVWCSSPGGVVLLWWAARLTESPPEIHPALPLP